MNKFITVILLVFSTAVFAQESTQELSADTILTIATVDTKPAFKGSEKEFYKYIGINFKYPAEARQANVQGRLVVEFIIEKDGSMSNYKITRNLYYGTDKELLRILVLAPKWTPGMKNGQAVRVKMTMPVTLSLSSGSPKPAMDKTRSNPNTW